jgi:UDP-2,4-diacetamido-2,4,6-trideoxy-beta-L-altropyranose hydrolase
MLVLRNATVDDMQQYFDWANDELVRQNSINTKIIGWDEHQKWFNNKLNSSSSFLYLAENKQSRIGQVRFDCENSEATINYSISIDYRGLGLGKEILKQAIEKISQDCLYIKIIKAKVKISNIASNKILIRLGFVERDKTKQTAVYQLALSDVDTFFKLN